MRVDEAEGGVLGQRDALARGRDRRRLALPGRRQRRGQRQHPLGAALQGLDHALAERRDALGLHRTLLEPVGLQPPPLAVGTGSLGVGPVSLHPLVDRRQPCRRRGRLLGQLEARAAQSGFDQLGATATINAVPFFERNGYAEASRGVKAFGPVCWLPVAFLRKRMPRIVRAGNGAAGVEGRCE